MVLPVWLLLQPRDLVNSQQLFVALGLLLLGVLIAGLTGQADLFASAEPISSTIPADAPPILPFLFVTIQIVFYGLQVLHTFLSGKPGALVYRRSYLFQMAKPVLLCC